MSEKIEKIDLEEITSPETLELVDTETVKTEVEIIDMACEPFVNANTSFKLNFRDMFVAFHSIIQNDIPNRFGQLKRQYLVIREKDDDMLKKYFSNSVGKDCLKYFVRNKLQITEKHAVVRCYASFASYPTRLAFVAINGVCDGHEKVKIDIFLKYYDVLIKHEITKQIDGITADGNDTLGSLFCYSGENEMVKSHVNSLHAQLLDNTTGKKDFEFLLDRFLFLLGENQEVKTDVKVDGAQTVSIKDVKDKIGSIEKNLDKISWLAGNIQPIPDSKEQQEVTRLHLSLKAKEHELETIEQKVLLLREMLDKCKVETLSRLVAE